MPSKPFLSSWATGGSHRKRGGSHRKRPESDTEQHVVNDNSWRVQGSWAKPWADALLMLLTRVSQQPCEVTVIGPILQTIIDEDSEAWSVS